MLVKEFQQLWRDRRMIPMLIAAPLIQLVVLGYAANLDVRNVALLFVDRDRTPESRELLERFTGSGYFELAGTEDDLGAVEEWLVEGRAEIVLVVGEGYGDALAAGRSPAVQVLADGTDNTSAGIALGYASRILSAAGEAPHLRDGSVAGPGVEIVPRVFYNPDLESRWFYMPAILAMVLLLVTMVLPSMAVVREKEIGTLEQIAVTPLRPWQLMLGKLLPFAMIGIVDMLLVTGIVVRVFGVPLRGSLWVLVLFSLPFILMTLSVGLLFSTLVRTQQQAMMASVFFGMVPMIYLSGLIFPIENMPTPVQWITYAVPLRYYAVILRGVFLKGAGVGVLWPQAAALTGIGVGLLLLATARFHKSLD